jgi:rhamnose transport system ATP-binding protein
MQQVREGEAHPVALLTLDRISKSFGAVRALRGVSIELRAGSVHALVGENGAGKSTLVNILGGVVTPDEGEIRLNGERVGLANPMLAEARGIAVVYQELNMIDHFDVAQNIYLSREPVRAGMFLDTRAMYRDCRTLLEELGIRLDPRTSVRRLTIAQHHLVEIARSLSKPASIVVMDEPTASLPSMEQQYLFDIVQQLRDRGVGVLYVSHRLDEVFELADTVTVLKDGARMASLPVKGTTKRELVQLMVGRDLSSEWFPERPVEAAGRETVLAVEGLTSPGLLSNISFDLHKGEIVGLAGLIGAGRTSLLRALFGVDPDATGTVRIKGRHVLLSSPRRAIANGMGYVTEDRRRDGAALNLPSLLTMISTRIPGRWIFFDRALGRRRADPIARRVRFSAGALESPVRELSGGNQQKVVVGKWLMVRPDILLCDEPTRGIDVGAKADVYKLLRELADSGMAILFSSSELPEILGLADRVLVLCEGRLTANMTAVGSTEVSIIEAASPAKVGSEPRGAQIPDELAIPPA